MAALGRLLGASWPPLGRSWVPSGWSWASLGRILALRGSPDLVSRWFLARPGWVWDPFWDRFGHACCEQSLYLRTALIAAENPSARSPAIIFSPSGAAVCAPHIRRLPKGEPCVPDIYSFVVSLPASKSYASKLSLRLLANGPAPILIFLPPDPHIPPRFARNLLLRPQNAIFLPSKNHLVFCLRFFSKKMRKSRILASQNHPQTLPKRLQNRCSKKHRFFRGFLLQFLYICYLGNLENINFP